MEKSSVFLVRRCQTLDLKHFETLDLAESVQRLHELFSGADHWSKQLRFDSCWDVGWWWWSLRFGCRIQSTAKPYINDNTNVFTFCSLSTAVCVSSMVSLFSVHGCRLHGSQIYSSEKIEVWAQVIDPSIGKMKFRNTGTVQTPEIETVHGHHGLRME